ncbi:MAG TPA: hypothetical protein VD978_03190 [Azospirillum sp.]|nr:hypothetical protein [Azospirillum sp.]
MSGRSTPIVSALPGRIRLRHPSLRQRSRSQELTARLAALDGLRIAESNPAVGSLLVLYDPACVERTAIEARVAAAASAVLDNGDAAPVNREEEGETALSLKRQLNRAAKIGMLGSMAVSLAALGTGKRLHAGAGALFVALMLIHTTVHRKRIFQ